MKIYEADDRTHTCRVRVPVMAPASRTIKTQSQFSRTFKKQSQYSVKPLCGVSENQQGTFQQSDGEEKKKMSIILTMNAKIMIIFITNVSKAFHLHRCVE